MFRISLPFPCALKNMVYGTDNAFSANAIVKIINDTMEGKNCSEKKLTIINFLKIIIRTDITVTYNRFKYK